MIPSTPTFRAAENTLTRSGRSDTAHRENFTIKAAAIAVDAPSTKDGGATKVPPRGNDPGHGSGQEPTQHNGHPSDILPAPHDGDVATALPALKDRELDGEARDHDHRFMDRVRKNGAGQGSNATGGDRAHRLAETTAQFGALRGRSEPMLSLYRNIERVAHSHATVFLSGETGSGKEVVARRLHELSRVRNGEFVSLNCGAVSSTLIESELFGHEQGSFTGAVRKHHGVFERANRGTLFLDEITEMPMDLQVKLLGVLETNSFHRLGGEKPLTTNARVVAATNRSPEAAVREGRLREDLYYRLLVFPISVPPLRDRGSDIALLAQFFLDELNAEAGMDKQFSRQAMERLQHHAWPGNVRELRNFVFQAFLMADQEIDAGTLCRSITYHVGGDHIDIPVGTSIADAEKKLILATMERFGGDKAKVAKVLGISLKTLYVRLNLYQAVSTVGANGGA